MIFTLRYFLLC